MTRRLFQFAFIGCEFNFQEPRNIGGIGIKRGLKEPNNVDPAYPAKFGTEARPRGAEEVAPR